MLYNFPMPPTLAGTEAEQLVQLHNYLYRMNEQLNQAIMSESVIINDVVAQQKNSVKTEELDATLVGQYNRAKALIIKTAKEVRHEMDKIVTELNEKYIAVSDWGTYQENIKQTIETTARGIVQEFDYDAQIDAVGTDFETYKIQSRGYIQSGIIGFDDENLPIYGIAVGQELANVTVTMDGVEYETIDMTKNLATYTSDRITFWQNGVDVAYISNSEMVINKIKVIGGVQLNDDWEISRVRGFSIKWIGGDVNG